MPIEGVSFQNTGFQGVSPAEATAQAEAASKVEAQKMIKEPGKGEKTKADSEQEEDREGDLQGRDTSDNEQEQEENDPEKIKKRLQNTKKYNVRFNSSIEMVEMVDAATGNVVETIAPDDLINILSNSKAFSGIFVDKQI